MFFAGKWRNAAKDQPPSPDERDYRYGRAPEYIVMIEGAELPTTLTFFRGQWVDSDANVYRVKWWAKLPQPPRRKRNG